MSNAGAIRNRRIPLVAPALRGGGLFAKDFMRYAVFPVTLTLMFLLMVVLGWAGNTVGNFSMIVSPEIVFERMIIVAAYAIGMGMMFEEKETGTWALLGSLPVARWRILVDKLAAGVVLLAFHVLLSGIVLGLIATGKAVPSPLTYWMHAIQPELPATALAALLTGMAVPLVLPANLVLVALAGPAALIAYMYGVQALGESRLMGLQQFRYITSPAMVLWGGVMLGVVTVRIMKPHFAPGRRISVQATPALRKPGTRGFDSPVARHYWPAFPVLLIGVVVLAFSLLKYTIAGKGGEKEMLYFVGVAFIGALLGSLGVSGVERLRPTFQLYQLPVPRSRILGRWLWALAWRTALLALVAGVLHRVLGEDDRSLEELHFYLVSALLSAACAFSTFLFCLFVRVKLFAIILALALVCPWGMAFGINLVALTVLPVFGWAEVVSYVVWAFLIAVGFPSLVAWLAVCRSPLLELAEGRRGTVLLAVGAVLASWGTLLLCVSPQHLWIVVFG